MQQLIILLVVFITSYSVVKLLPEVTPIVIITTDNDPSTNLPLEIIDEPKILASMKIIKRPDGTRNFISDQNTAEFFKL
jgi:hypothetical protein